MPENHRAHPQSVFTGGESVAAHRHIDAYAAVVLEGSYTEASFDGRFECGPGTVIVHPAFHRHANDIGTEGARVMNLPLPQLRTDFSGYRLGRLVDLPAFLDLALADQQEAAAAALEEADGSGPIAPPAWLSRFIFELSMGQAVEASAACAGVTPEHASRVAKSWFGESPSAIRGEGRFRRALSAIREGVSLADAASLAGYADQAHMTRMLKRMTGTTPGRLVFA